MICIGITIGISPSGALLHTIGIGTIIGIGIGVGQWNCTITAIEHIICNVFVFILTIFEREQKKVVKPQTKRLLELKRVG